MVEGGRDDDRGGIDNVDDAEENGEDDRGEGVVVVVVDGTMDGVDVSRGTADGQGAADSAISSTTEAMTDAAVSTSSSSSSSSVSSIAIAASALKGEGVLSALQRRCAEAAPNEGDLWCSVTKETKLRR
jgi:3-oxoacyl-ACP reductase-like protein